MTCKMGSISLKERRKEDEPMAARTVPNILAAVSFLFLFVAAPLPGVAQTAGPCAETVAKFCKDVTPGGGRIMKCLADHRDDQSIACKDWLQDQNKSLQELNTSCPEEIVKLCGSGAPDSVRIYRCLDDNYVGLKSDCRDKLREIRDRMQ
jgi:hypothetical protein